MGEVNRYKFAWSHAYGDEVAVNEEFVLASDYDALQKELEFWRAKASDAMSISRQVELVGLKDRAERAERELAEAREKYQHTEDEKNVLSMDLAMALERERECEEAIIKAHHWGTDELMDGADGHGLFPNPWFNLPAVVRALGRNKN